MTKRNSMLWFSAIFCFAVCCAQTSLLIGQEKELTAAELIAAHVKSLGKPADVAQIKSRGISGKAAVQFIQGAKGQINDGQFICVSEGNKLGLRMTFSDTNYPQEYFAYNGSEVSVGYISPGQRSPLADFIFRYNGLMKEGFLGGTLSTTWPLLRAKQNDYVYSKEKLENGDYHVLEYTSKNTQGNVKIKLYFEPKTYHHVRTEYRVRLSNDLSAMESVNTGGNPDPINRDAILSSGRPGATRPRATIQGNQADSIYMMTEKFGNFANIGGLVLPQDYSIEYSMEGTGATFLAKWVLLAEHWMPNRGNIDQSFFVAQK
ncbi:MAG: hypothetical protein QUT30_19595 [Acidobacteriota bacterium]|nr:hypothetical protein [Acidobacteriota bacterium]